MCVGNLGRRRRGRATRRRPSADVGARHLPAGCRRRPPGHPAAAPHGRAPGEQLQRGGIIRRRPALHQPAGLGRRRAGRRPAGLPGGALPTDRALRNRVRLPARSSPMQLRRSNSIAAHGASHHARAHINPRWCTHPAPPLPHPAPTLPNGCIAAQRPRAVPCAGTCRSETDTRSTGSSLAIRSSSHLSLSRSARHVDGRGFQ